MKVDRLSLVHLFSIASENLPLVEEYFYIKSDFVWYKRSPHIPRCTDVK